MARDRRGLPHGEACDSREMPVDALYPLRFRPVFRRYIWGGRRLATQLGKPLGPGDDYAESWEICDRGRDQSVVEGGPLAGLSLGDTGRGAWGGVVGPPSSAGPFPLAGEVPRRGPRRCRSRSIPTTPRPPGSIRPTPARSEAFVVMAAEPGSTIYAGLKPGVDRQALAEAIRQGTCPELLHRFEPVPGDCIFLPPGTVHALGQGLLVAEIQQVQQRHLSAVRLEPPGPRRQAAALARPARPWTWSISPAGRSFRSSRGRPAGRASAGWSNASGSGWTAGTWTVRESIGGDGRCHILCVLEGAVSRRGGPAAGTPLGRGSTALLPAALGPGPRDPAGQGGAAGRIFAVDSSSFQPTKSI